MTRPFVLGLTGSIGMGKSTTAAMFAAEDVPVWDADAVVHRLYSAGQPAAQAIAERFPQVMAPDGSVDRSLLRTLVAADPAVLDRLNAIVHPLTAADRAAFIAANRAAPVLLLDIPLLYETGADAICDATVVVSVPMEIQRERVLARGMSAADFEMILARQMPDAEKRRRATYVIEALTEDGARAAVRGLLQELRSEHA
ncbi:dephospho-CoA kinase [Frigidibacter sp. RF13]|uniref:dephospho-CoA kinase n=1 Tax=Frigidibacter sp. RF13 TaxID=2997340 RepID=UPI002270ECB8|nr:dephospho-CoA kinase [Frigidibacter sp. RF13]MCY1126427.1 dephospho-CoA kinase [Frigidibacter sp. RF13]